MNRIIPFLSLLLLLSCRHVEYITIPEVHTTIVRDSVIITDSVDRVHIVFTQGDTVIVRDSVTIVKVRRENHADTIRDTIPDKRLLTSLNRKLLTAEAEASRLRSSNNILLALLISLFLVFLIRYLYGKFKHQRCQHRP